MLKYTPTWLKVSGWVGGWPMRLYCKLPRSSYCYLVDLGA